jgi:putative ABC transport system permease protein
MKIGRSLRISAKQLAAHKLRTTLALLGVVIGVSTVIVMVAVGNGARQDVLRRVEDMGSNLVIVSAGQARPSAGRQRTRALVTTLTLRDFEALVAECSTVDAAAPFESRRMQIRYGAQGSTTNVVGTTHDYPAIRNLKIDRGSFFGEEENAAASRVAILGSTVVTNLFGDADPMGEQVRVGLVPFEVIGVLQSKGLDMNGADQDDQVYVPIRTALRRIFNQDHLAAIHVSSQRASTVDETVEEIRALLRERHRLDRTGAPDDFTIQTQAELLDAQRQVGDTFTTLVAGIASVSLAVGGIGILAIMLIAIRERTKEIGLRMAVGAGRKDVRLQFLMEATALGVGGGLAGVALGIASAALLAVATSWPISVSLSSVILPFAFSLFVGAFFGVYPATRAARLDPIEALRSE